ncbi:DUF169 domain-containing protein [Desulfitobacterium chlororespirans]|uniref:Uncharacterized conserved protein, DUF169 family n=1 Tax=Desulfitobacterium chlororespirans DSM 11544 TaxID=1121395 RepID=A0A1M7UFV9_9FIRM|nr:DUF169 domain-containing protein [Desulfitobacterium chlororespirans]SHN81882.1 Uncharacterized conserved protein, DUF169 family [Desulfitobacterium chlororespirans DSM 11544]
MNRKTVIVAEMDYAGAQEVLERLLRLDYHPVALKFFKTQEEANHYRVEKKMAAKVTFCQYTAASRMANYVLKGTKDNLLCENCLISFGYNEPTEEDIMAHRLFVIDPEKAKRIVASKPSLPFGEIHSFMTAPLAKTPVDPDIVLFVCNPFQAYHILNDYVGAFDVHPLQFNHTLNSAVCGGAVWSYLNHKPNMNTMCAGSYTSGKTEKGEVNVFIPGDQIINLTKQLVARTEYSGGASLLSAGNEWPGLDVCKKCPMVRIKDNDDVNKTS